MNQLKIFHDYSAGSVERSANEWLKNNKDYIILDVRLAVDEGDFTIMIWYGIEEKGE